MESSLVSELTHDLTIRESTRLKKYIEAKQLYKDPNQSYALRENVTNELCGTFNHLKNSYSCECGHSSYIAKRSCNTLKCPECGKQASMNRGKEIQKRMWYGKRYYDAQLYHAVISISIFQLFILLAIGVKEFEKRFIIPYAKRLWDGFVIIRHTDRLDDAGNRYPSPHWHFIALTPRLRPFGKNDYRDMRKELKYAFVVKYMYKLVNGQRVYQLKSPKDVLGVANYQLTHCSWDKGSIAYRYFGNVSNCKLRVVDDYIQYRDVKQECKECKGNLYEIEEFEIEKYHYSKLVKNLMKGVKKQIELKKFFNGWDLSLKSRLNELKDLKIVDSIKILKFNKKNVAIVRELIDVKLPDNILELDALYRERQKQLNEYRKTRNKINDGGGLINAFITVENNR